MKYYSPHIFHTEFLEELFKIIYACDQDQYSQNYTRNTRHIRSSFVQGGGVLELQPTLPKGRLANRHLETLIRLGIVCILSKALYGRERLYGRLLI
jgi:hypothetical protein